MEQVKLNIHCDAKALCAAGREVAALMSRLGAAESQRRIGRPIDDTLIGDLVALEVEPKRSDAVTVRARPSKEFERVLAARQP
jgi:hypothetical protein